MAARIFFFYGDLEEIVFEQIQVHDAVSYIPSQNARGPIAKSVRPREFSD